MLNHAGLILITLIWLVGTGLRIYRQAHYYQLEEYMSGRYLRWLFSARERWLPKRTTIAVTASTFLTVFMSEAPGNFVPLALGVVAGIIGVWPPRRTEVKKPFRATARAKRMLGAAFALLAVCGILWLVLLSRLGSLADSQYASVVCSAVGLVLFLLAPILLVLGNLLMTPVEATLRRRFIASAKRTLADIHPTVIGLTGSYGKTSTKHYLAHILNGRYKAYPTPKSYNTLMGICIAINNEIANDHSIDYFIAEMGAYIPGEIERLCDLTQPTIGIEIEVGPQHLERFGSLENTAKAKYELIKGLPANGVGVFNWDNPYVRDMYERGYPATRLAVSREVAPDAVPAGGPRFVASDIEETLDGLRFTVTDTQTKTAEPFMTTVLGLHSVTNILLAVAVAVHEGMTLKEIARRVRTLQPAESRLVRQTTAEGVTILNDAYSANPTGAASALRVLGLHQSGRRVVVTPGMVELGPMMESANHALGQTAAAHATDIILVGRKQTEPIHAGAIAAGFPPERLQIVDTLAESLQWVQNNLRGGDTVLYLNDLPDTYSS
jgi:UDP-N-acetylmuramoyl-tripeptide--D-alanyl-D-alanine ligase